LNCHYIHLETSESTNIYASNYIANNKPSTPVAVFTFNQSDGRGQIGRKWYSGTDQNLSFSLILPFSSFPVTDFYKLTMKYSLVLVEFLRQYIGVECSVKWPNDIYVGNKKLAGILIQNVISGRNIQYSIFGLGLNVNTLDFPTDIPNPISLKQITGKHYEIKTLQYEMSEYLCQHLQFGETFAKIKARYLKALYRYNAVNNFEDLVGVRIEARIMDVLDNGHLILEDTEGKRKAYNFGDIRYIV